MVEAKDSNLIPVTRELAKDALKKVASGGGIDGILDLSTEELDAVAEIFVGPKNPDLDSEKVNWSGLPEEYRTN